MQRYKIYGLFLILIFIMVGCGGGIPIPPIGNGSSSAYVYEHEAYHMHYYNKHLPPTVGVYEDKIYIALYRFVFQYDGFTIRFKKPYEVSTFSADDISGLRSIPYRFAVLYDSDDYREKWPTYIFLFEGEKQSIYFEWDIFSRGYMKGHSYETGNIKVFVLAQDATAEERKVFARYRKRFDQARAEAAKANAALNHYAAYVLGAFSSQLKKSVAKSLSTDSSTTGNTKCDIYRNKCLEYCDQKSNKSSGLSMSSKENCRWGCKRGAKACERGNDAEWKVATCHALCEGVEKHDSDIFIPFSNSSFDDCREDCEVSFFK